MPGAASAPEKRASRKAGTAPGRLHVHLRAELRAFTGAQAWLRVFRLPAYAPDLNPVEGVWSVLKGGVLANLAVASFARLVQVIRHGLKKIQYPARPPRRLPRRDRADPGTRLITCRSRRARICPPGYIQYRPALIDGFLALAA